MDINKLKAFVCVVRCQSFTRAAAELYISQPALSKKISDFEKEIGTPLLVRDNRTMELTPAGKLLFNEAPSLLKIGDDLEAKARKLGQNPGSQLRIACSGIEYGRLHSIINGFRKAHSDVSIVLRRMSAAEIKQAIMTDMVDLAFQTHFEVEREPEIDHVPFVRDNLAVVMSKEHPLAGQESVNMEQLEDEVYYGIQPQADHMPFTRMINQLVEAGYEPQEIRVAHSVDELVLSVSCGLGVAHLFAKTEQVHGGLIHYAKCESPNMELQIDVVWNRNNPNPAVQWFADFVRQKNETEPEWL